jgi:mRNA-degrading endonuclease RelE of RelBE toxin-antitoxin system
MAYTLIWQPAAVAGLVLIRGVDPQVAKAVRAAVSALADEARPLDSTPLGSEGLRRLRVGDARILYEVDDTHQAIHVLTVGRIHRESRTSGPTGRGLSLCA